MNARAPLASVRLREAGASLPAAFGADGSTAQTLKFSSPSLSFTYRISLLSRLKKKVGIGRFVSVVTSRALSKASLVFLT